MKKYIILIAIMIAAVRVSAQQELMISQYMFNSMVLNPAYAGTHDYWSTSLLHRSQWVKFDNAPRTQFLSADGQIIGGKAGLGFNVSNDALGITNILDLNANAATHVKMGKGKLSFGIRLGASRYSAQLTDAIIKDVEDPVYANNINGTMIPRVGAGLYYYQSNFFAGLAVPSLLSIDDKISYTETGINSFYKSHVYINTGMVFTPVPELAIKPSVLVKVQGNQVNVDLNCNALFMNKFWFGAGYRTGDALVTMLEWNINPQLR
ncbi:MAG: PorP/SprF family type IX secretion system membrane protein, partial [Flavobacteriales bacterium]